MPLAQLSIDISLPALPEVARALHTDTTNMQLMVAAFLLGNAIALFFSGPISEHLGRKKIIISGLILYFIGSIILGFSTTVTELFLFRFIQGAGAGMVITAIRASAKEMFTGKLLLKFVAVMTLIWALAPIFAPLAGAYIQTYFGWHATYFLLSAYSVLFILMVILFFPEPLKQHKRTRFSWSNILKNYGVFFKDKKYRTYLISLTSSYAVIIIYSVSSPFILEKNFNVKVLEYGHILLLIGLSFLFGSVVNTLFKKWLHEKFLLILGIVVSILGTLYLLAMHYFNYVTEVEFFISGVLIYLGVGMSIAISMTHALDMFEEGLGYSSSLLGFVPILGCFISLFVLSFLPHNTVLPMAIFILVLKVIALFFVIRVSIHERKQA